MSEGNDLTEGKLFPNMIKFCLPLLITNLLKSIYSIVDGIWVGRLVGDAGLSTITNCWPIMLIIDAFLTGVAVITSIMVSQSYTSENKEKIKEIITPLYLISVIVGIVIAIFLFLSNDFWFYLFNTPKEIVSEAKTYVIIILLGFIFYFVGYTFVSGIRAIGDSKTSLKIMAITEISNIILDPILIKLGLGVKGAAIASAIAMFICFLIGYFSVKKNELLKFNIKYLKIKKDFIKKAIKLGIPIVIQEIATIFTIILELNLSNSLGIKGGSTYGIVSKFQAVIWIIGNTISEMITVVVGQFIGKNEPDRIKDVMKNGLKLIILPALLIIVFVSLGSRFFAEIFTDSNEVIVLTIRYMHIVGIGYATVPLYQLLYGMVIGTGNTRYSFLGFFVSTVTEIALALYLNNITGNVFFSLGIGITMWYIVGIFMFSMFYFSKRWYNEKICV